jgi:AcrR family transcriptional regulator
VSPAPARTSTTEIVAAGRDLLEAGGLRAVTMEAVAQQVGVRAPSLYKRIPGRGALLAAIATAVLGELGDLLAPLARDPDAAAGLRSAALAYRAFAQANPRAYELLYMDLPPDSRPPVEVTARAAGPVLDLTARLVGPDQALEAARVVTAFVHGFVSMELAGAFRLGADLDGAYRYGLDVLVGALARRRRGVRGTRPSRMTADRLDGSAAQDVVEEASRESIGSVGGRISAEASAKRPDELLPARGVVGP